MPAKIHPVRLGESLGWKIREIPAGLKEGFRNWMCVALSETNRLLCWGTEYNQIFLYDFWAGRWLDPIGWEDIGDDAQHAQEFIVGDICCTQNYLLVGIDGSYYVHAFSEMKSQEDIWTWE